MDNPQHRSASRAGRLLAEALFELAEQRADVRAALEELRDFKYRRGKKLPKKIRALDGKKVRVKGFMNIDTPEGMEEFLLVSDSCGCDGTTKPHHFVLVQLDGETTTFNPDEITVTGTISIGEEEQDGLVTSVFRIKAESVE